MQIILESTPLVMSHLVRHSYAWRSSVCLGYSEPVDKKLHAPGPGPCLVRRPDVLDVLS